jgi:hypothetical protein
MTQLTQTQVVHVRFEGRSEELTLDILNLTAQSTDTQIKRAVAHYFERKSDYFNSFVVVRNSQAIIVRPEAIYG